MATSYSLIIWNEFHFEREKKSHFWFLTSLFRFCSTVRNKQAFRIWRQNKLYGKMQPRSDAGQQRFMFYREGKTPWREIFLTFARTRNWSFMFSQMKCVFSYLLSVKFHLIFYTHELFSMYFPKCIGNFNSHVDFKNLYS